MKHCILDPKSLQISLDLSMESITIALKQQMLNR